MSVDERAPSLAPTLPPPLELQSERGTILRQFTTENFAEYEPEIRALAERNMRRLDLAGIPPSHYLADSAEPDTLGYIISRNSSIYRVMGIFVSDELVGSLEGHAHDGEAHVVYLWIGQDYDGQGLGTDAFRTYLRHLYEQEGVKVTTTLVAHGNEPSIKMHQKLGFHRMPSQPDGDLKYELTKEEWENQQKDT